jgi:hypothetical protein
LAVNVRLFESLDEAAADAGGALDRAAQPCLFSRIDWFRLLALHCPPPGQLQIVRAQAAEGSAWLFLAREGGAAEAYANYYALRAGPIGAPALFPALAAALKRHRIARLALEPVADPAPFAAALRGAGWMVRSAPRAANWRIETRGLSFADYWAARPGKLRSTAARKAKAAAIEVRLYDRFDAEGWAAYEAVYRASWKPEEGSFPFLRALAEQEGAAGTLRLGLAFHEGCPVAAQLWTVENGTAIIHKLAYAEHAKPFSPGTLLSRAMFAHVIDTDRAAWIDYGNGDEPYKADWMGERRMLWRLQAFNPATIGGLAGAARALAARLRSR